MLNEDLKQFRHYLKLDAFSLATTAVHAFTMMLIWNWHATKYVGFKPINFVGAFIIVFFIRRLFSLRFSIEVKSLKTLLHYMQPYDEKRITKAENIQILAECCIMLLIAYLLRFII